MFPNENVEGQTQKCIFDTQMVTLVRANLRADVEQIFELNVRTRLSIPNLQHSKDVCAMLRVILRT